MRLDHGHQLQPRPQHGHQRAFRADQRPGDVEAPFRQQAVQVVAGHAPRDVQVVGADLIGVRVAQCPQLRVDLGRPATGALDPVVLLVAGRPDPHPGAVVEQHLQLHDVVDHFPGALSGRPARVVADHAAERAVRVGGRQRPELQAGRPELVVEHIHDDARLHQAGAVLPVDLQQPVAVLRPVQNHRGVGAFAGEAGPAAAGQHRGVVAPAHLDRGHRGFDRTRHHHAERDLPVVRGIGGVRPARSGVEAHLAVDGGGQVAGEGGEVHVAGGLGGRHHRIGEPHGRGHASVTSSDVMSGSRADRFPSPARLPVPPAPKQPRAARLFAAVRVG